MSLIAEAQPAGRTVRAVYESLRDEILDDLCQAMPVDIVLRCRSRRDQPRSNSAAIPAHQQKDVAFC
jgi:hypothetical protein